MDVGEQQRIVTVEPIEDPVPRQVPAPEEPAEEPEGLPDEPERIPA